MRREHTPAGEIRELQQQVDWLQHELDLVYHHLGGEYSLSCKDDVIAAIEHELLAAEGAGFLIDGNGPVTRSSVSRSPARSLRFVSPTPA